MKGRKLVGLNPTKKHRMDLRGFAGTSLSYKQQLLGLVVGIWGSAGGTPLAGVMCKVPRKTWGAVPGPRLLGFP